MSDTQSVPRPASRALGQEERRRVTVLFADMVDFTPTAERLGEEAAYQLMQSIFALMAKAVREQGGDVDYFTGDGIMALFGIPVALEDATLRACRASLQIQQRLGAIEAETEARLGVRPCIRIGINAGPVVAGQIEGGRASVSGDTINLASRLQALAEPGTVVLGEAAHRLVDGLADCTFVGEHHVKGKSEAQKVWRLDAVKANALRFDAELSRGLTDYVGRSIARRPWSSRGAARRTAGRRRCSSSSICCAARFAWPPPTARPTSGRS